MAGVTGSCFPSFSLLRKESEECGMHRLLFAFSSSREAMDAAGVPYRELDVFELARMGTERLLGVPGATESDKEEEE